MIGNTQHTWARGASHLSLIEVQKDRALVCRLVYPARIEVRIILSVEGEVQHQARIVLCLRCGGFMSRQTWPPVGRTLSSFREACAQFGGTGTSRDSEKKLIESDVMSMSVMSVWS